MARSHARILLSIWHDEDFTTLTSGAQRVYLMLLSQDSLNYCGVTLWTPKRWARMATNTTAKTIEKDVAELANRRFIITDDETEEMWARSFLKHDEAWKSPNLIPSIASSFDAVHSRWIREGIVGWFHERFPDGFRDYIVNTLCEGDEEGVRRRFPKGLPERFLERLGEGLPEPPPEPFSRAGARIPSPTTSPAPPPTPSPSPPGFLTPATTNPTHTLAHLLADLIEANGSRRPNVTRSWLEDFETLINVHGPTDVEAIIRWCQADQFWRGNVLTSTSFRKKFDQLRLHSQRAPQLAVVPGDPIAEYRRQHGLEGAS